MWLPFSGPLAEVLPAAENHQRMELSHEMSAAVTARIEGTFGTARRWCRDEKLPGIVAELFTMYRIHRIVPFCTALVASCVFAAPVLGQFAALSAIGAPRNARAVRDSTLAMSSAVNVPERGHAWSAPARFSAALAGTVAVGMLSGIAGAVSAGPSCGDVCDNGGANRSEISMAVGAPIGAIAFAALPRLGSPCSALRTRLRSSAAGGLLGALGGALVGAVAADAYGHSTRRGSLEVGVGVGALLGATIATENCR